MLFPISWGGALLRSCRPPCALSVLALASASVAALPAMAAEPVVAETTMTLGTVTVSGDSGPLVARSVLSSVNVLPAERIETSLAANNWQLFELVPGTMLTFFNQGTTSGKLSFRGFNGEGEINAVKLLIDGVPSNSNDGNMPYIDLAPRLDIESIEVVKGTNDPRYGLHNIAGNVNINTRRGGDYRELRVGGGSFGTRDVQAAIGVDQGALTQNYALSVNESDGHRGHSDARNVGLSGKWFLNSPDGRSHVGLIARFYEAQAQEAGYLTLAQRQANPWQSPAYNSTDQDRRRVSQFALQGQTQWGEQTTLNAQVYVNDLDDRRFVRYSSSVSQQERYVAETHVGSSLTATWRAGQTAVGGLTVVAGWDTEHQDNRSERYNTVSQVRSAQTRNQQFDFNVSGAFVQAIVKPTNQLTITPALRVDQISGSYTNLLNGRTYDVNGYGLVKQPKLSAVYAWSPAASVYANAGRSFQVGVGTASYKVNQSQDLAPSVNDGWELGLKLKPQDWLDARVALWEQTASNEARRRLNDPSNDSENIGKTRRRGLDVELNAQIDRRTRGWASVSWQQSRILKADAASLNTEGKEIDHVPRALASLGLEHQLGQDWRVSGWMTHQGAYYLERTNSTGRWGGFTLWNASASYRINAKTTLDLQVRNLTNRRYEYVWFDGVQSLHAPGAPRSGFASVTVKF